MSFAPWYCNPHRHFYSVRFRRFPADIVGQIFQIPFVSQAVDLPVFWPLLAVSAWSAMLTNRIPPIGSMTVVHVGQAGPPTWEKLNISISACRKSDREDVCMVSEHKLWSRINDFRMKLWIAFLPSCMVDFQIINLPHWIAFLREVR